MTRRGPLISLVLALIFSAFVVFAGYAGLGPLPPLGPTFNPETGVWAAAAGSKTPSTQSLSVPGLDHPVTVRFSAQGTAYIKAQDDHDLFFAIGYMQAKNRLFQMDLMRRQGEGLLSEVVGPAALSSDKFELQLGLLRTARANWASLSPHSSARKAVIAFSAGVNDVIRQDESHGTLPVMFKLLGYKPAAWTPVDSLVVQGDMTQDLDYTTAPVEYRLLTRSLGKSKTMSWFPIDEPNPQHPYDLGPYTKLPLTPIPSQAAVQGSRELAGGVPGGGLTASVGTSASSGSVRHAETVALQDAVTLTQTFRHDFSDSNNWAISGSKTANCQTMMAGDPHLSQTLPPIWYQISGQAPGYDFSGVSIPGVPMIVIGHNQNIAWSLTNVQNQATFMYQEKTSPSHPNQYFWKGAWRAMKVIHYSIPVKGAATSALTVKLTIHGPLMTQSGQTLAVDWIGALPSNDIQAILDMVRSENFSQFKHALSLWHSPSQNFVYADSHGNIGLISAGYYAEVQHGQPWTVLSGTGSDDIVGTIPYQAVPQAYNPADGLVFSANQREVTSAYPYYIGNSLDFFDTGYRADTIYNTLINAHHLTAADIARLQNNTQDYLAQLMVPKLITALSGTSSTPAEQTARHMLANWNGNMGVHSASATLWWYFINQYLKAAFGPWWTQYHVPTSTDPNLSLNATSEAATPLVEDLEAWTANDPTNPTFSLPDGTHRTAPAVMRAAFKSTVQILAKKLGPNPASWQWGKVHKRSFPSLAQIAALGYGPRASSGDQWTVDAADGGLLSEAGPSWRMIVNWRGPGKAPLAEGVYPGGQSENPMSPWYGNQIPAWWDGRYYPMGSVAQMAGKHQAALWTLNP